MKRINKLQRLLDLRLENKTKQERIDIVNAEAEQDDEVDELPKDIDDEKIENINENLDFIVIDTTAFI